MHNGRGVWRDEEGRTWHERNEHHQHQLRGRHCMTDERVRERAPRQLVARTKAIIIN